MTKEIILNFLKEYGGSIISSNDLSPEWINQARASGRMYVDDNGFGFVWEPNIKCLPETEEEVAVFERWYPLKIKLPDSLSAEKFFDRMKQRQMEEKQKKNN